MTGYDKQLFLRQDLPKDLLCVVCLQVLKDPINCKSCELFLCLSCTKKACQHNHKCQHEFMGANKYIKNKIDELQIKCIYSRFGCEFNSKVSEIERHQENCQFKSNPKENEEILPEETNEIFKNTFKACPISQIDCDLGCKQSLEHLKKEKQECVEWLNGIIENFEKSQIGFREENSELQKDLETQKDIQEKNLLALKFELQSKEAQQQSLIKETEETKEKYERIIKQLEEESCYKMKIFHENTEKRVEFYIEKTKEDYSLFSKYFGENIQSYFDNVKQNVEIFSAQIENKTENILKKPKEIVKESEMKQSGLKEESKEKNNTPIKKVAVLN